VYDMCCTPAVVDSIARLRDRYTIAAIPRPRARHKFIEDMSAMSSSVDARSAVASLETLPSLGSAAGAVAARHHAAGSPANAYSGSSAAPKSSACCTAPLGLCVEPPAPTSSSLGTTHVTLV
jgi:hypothetical protein